MLFSSAARRVQLIVVADLGHLEPPKPRKPFGFLGFFYARAEEGRVKTEVLSVRLSPRPHAHGWTRCAQTSLQRRADVVRLLIASAGLDDLPQAWRELSADERRLLQESR